MVSGDASGSKRKAESKPAPSNPKGAAPPSCLTAKGLPPALLLYQLLYIHRLQDKLPGDQLPLVGERRSPRCSCPQSTQNDSIHRANFFTRSRRNVFSYCLKRLVLLITIGN